MNRFLTNIFFLQLILLSLGTMIGCSSKNSKNDDSVMLEDIHSRATDSIDLSLYGVHLGEPLDSLMSRIPNITKVPFDSLNKAPKYSLPYDKEEAKLIFGDLSIEIYRGDTIFIADHKNYQHHDKDGFFKDFPLEKVRHRAILCFLIKNNKVFQSEIYICYTICGYENINLTLEDFRGTIEKMYYDRYNEPDSIMMINKRTNRAAFVGYNEDPVIRSEIYEQLGGSSYSETFNIFKEDVWIWSNAKIYADWNFHPYKNGQKWFWGPAGIVRVSYVDLVAIKKEKDIILRQLERERQDSIRNIQQKQLEDSRIYKSQDI